MDHRVKPGGDGRIRWLFDKTRAHSRRENEFYFTSPQPSPLWGEGAHSRRGNGASCSVGIATLNPPYKPHFARRMIAL